MNTLSEGYTKVDTETLRKMMEQVPSPLVVDLRDKSGYSLGHLPAAVSLPMKPGFWKNLVNRFRLSWLLGPDKDRIIVFY